MGEEREPGALVGDAVIAGQRPSVIEVNAAGTLMGFRWNDSSDVDEIVALDATTGTVTVLGTVGDLARREPPGDAAPSWLRMVREVAAMDAPVARLVFGESLPAGLSLLE